MCYLTGSGAPSMNCTTGAALYTDSGNGNFYICTATNPWTLKGAAGAAGATGAAGQGYTWRGAYAGGTTYSAYDTVSYSGSSYVCILGSTGNLPTNGTYFALAASKGDTGASGSGTGTINSGTTGQVAAYTGAGITVGGVGPGTTAQVLHGNAAGQPRYGSVSMTADVTGTLPVVNGGTGLATQTAHALYVGNGTSAPTAVGLGTTTQVLHGNASADPAFGALVTADLPSGEGRIGRSVAVQ